MDAKKIIAFSTICCASCGMIFVSVGSAGGSLGFIYIHIFFKAMLFMVFGVFIHMVL